MKESEIKANEIIDLVNKEKTIKNIKSKVSNNEDEWYNYSSKAYSILLINARKKREEKERNQYVLATSNNDLLRILEINEKLADHALLLPIFSTIGELKDINSLMKDFPNTLSKLIQIIGKKTMNPRLRILQSRGRFEKFECFKIFKKIIDAATLSYYRTNFISCYLTLVPVIEGIILRWMGYSFSDKKPEFDKIKKFFKNSAMRQPCPINIQFHNVYIKVCDEILNNHFYRPTTNGDSYANFNRHLAAHLLKDDDFATKENCIRLFMLLDAMSEIYFYESRKSDPKFDVKNEDLSEEIDLIIEIVSQNTEITPEQKLFKTRFIDLV